MKKLYVYASLDECDPKSEAYHREGGLIVVTSGHPNDAVPAGTGNEYWTVEDGGNVRKVGLPGADHVFVVPDDSPDLVLPFPDPCYVQSAVQERSSVSPPIQETRGTAANANGAAAPISTRHDQSQTSARDCPSPHP